MGVPTGIIRKKFFLIHTDPTRSRATVLTYSGPSVPSLVAITPFLPKLLIFPYKWAVGRAEQMGRFGPFARAFYAAQAHLFRGFLAPYTLGEPENIQSWYHWIDIDQPYPVAPLTQVFAFCRGGGGAHSLLKLLEKYREFGIKS